MPDKNIQYDSPEPAFLQKLRAQYAGQAQPRTQAHQQMTRRVRGVSSQDNVEDEPQILIDHDSDKALSKEERDSLIAEARAATQKKPADKQERHEISVTDPTVIAKESRVECGIVKPRKRQAKHIAVDTYETEAPTKLAKKKQSVPLSFETD